MAVWLALFGIILLRAGGTYGLGRLARRGVSRLRRIQLLIDSPRYMKAETVLNRWGAPVVAVSFLTIGFQTLVNLAAGTTRMPLIRYLPALGVGGAAWASVYSTVGFIGFEAVAYVYERAPVLTVVGICVFVCVVLALLLVRRRAVSSGTGA